MRKMKSRVLAVLMAAGMIFTAQGMTVLAGTTGIGAAKTASQTGGPGEVKQDIGTVSAKRAMIMSIPAMVTRMAVL